jgi:phosphoglycolate phosphatase
VANAQLLGLWPDGGEMKLLFDLDGTLTDPFVGITESIRAALVGLGRPAPPAESLGWCIGPPLKASLMHLLATEDEALAEAALALYRKRFGVVGLFENRVYPGIPEALETLKIEGHTLYVATSKPKVFAARILEHFALGPYFDAVYGSELDGTLSEKGDLIAHILSKEAVVATEAVMIGDRRHDMAGALRNGVRPFGVLWGYGSRAELEGAGAIRCLGSPAELRDGFRDDLG